MAAHNIYLQDKRRKSPQNYPYIVFEGNPCGLKNVFDSSMVNEPSGFVPLKFYCNEILVGQHGLMMSGGQLMSQTAHFSNVRRYIYTERVFSFFSQCFSKQQACYCTQ